MANRNHLFASLFLLLTLGGATRCAGQELLAPLWSGLNDGYRSGGMTLQGEVAYLLLPKELRVYNLAGDGIPRFVRSIGTSLDDEKGREGLILGSHYSARQIMDVGYMGLHAHDTLLAGWSRDSGVVIWSIADPLAPRQIYARSWKEVISVEVAWGRIYIITSTDQGGYVLEIDMDDSATVRGLGFREYGFSSLSIDDNYLYAISNEFDNQGIAFYELFEDRPAEGAGAFMASYFAINDVAGWDSGTIVLTDGHGDLEIWERWGWEEHTYTILYYIKRINGELVSHRVIYPTLPGGYEPLDVEIVDSLILFRARQTFTIASLPSETIIPARLRGDSALEFLPPLDLGLRRGTVRHFDLDGNRLVWTSADALHSARINPDGSVTHLGDISTSTVCYDVEGRERIAYVAATDSLLALDFSDPAHPQWLSSLPQRTEGIALVGEDRILLFDSTLVLFDYSDPRAPRLLDTLHLGEGNIARRALAREDGVTAIAGMSQGVWLVAVESDTLRYLRRLEGVHGTDLYWKENVLYVSELGRIGTIWDVSVAEEPVYVDTIMGKGEGSSIGGFGDTVSIGIGEELIFLNTEDIYRPYWVYSEQVGGAAGHQYADRLLFVDGVDVRSVQGDYETFFSIFSVAPDGHVTSRLPVDGIASFGGNFCLSDSLLITSAYTRGLFVYELPLATLGVSDRRTFNSEILLSATPNIVTDCTELHFRLTEPGKNILLRVYNLSGNEVDHIPLGDQHRGDHRISYSPALSAGAYVIRLEVGGDPTAETMLILQ